MNNVMGKDWSRGYYMAITKANLKDPLIKTWQRQVESGKMSKQQYERLRDIVNDKKPNYVAKVVVEWK